MSATEWCDEIRLPYDFKKVKLNFSSLNFYHRKEKQKKTLRDCGLEFSRKETAKDRNLNGIVVKAKREYRKVLIFSAVFALLIKSAWQKIRDRTRAQSTENSPSPQHHLTAFATCITSTLRTYYTRLTQSPHRLRMRFSHVCRAFDHPWQGVVPA